MTNTKTIRVTWNSGVMIFDVPFWASESGIINRVKKLVPWLVVPFEIETLSNIQKMDRNCRVI